MTTKAQTKQVRDRYIQDILKKDALLNATPEQVENWVDANVTDLTSAKEAIKRIIKLELALVRIIEKRTGHLNRGE